MTDILAELDAAIAAADSTTGDLCDQYLAGAMVGVRDAIDGATCEPVCDALDHQGPPWYGGCGGDTMARWRPPELDPPVMVGPAQSYRSWISAHLAPPLEARTAILDEWVPTGVSADVESALWSSPTVDPIGDITRAMTRAYESWGLAIDHALLNGPGTLNIWSNEPRFRDPVREMTYHFQGVTIEVADPQEEPDCLNPPARTLAEITRFQQYVDPGPYVPPPAAWRDRPQVRRAMRGQLPFGVATRASARRGGHVEVTI